MSLREIYNQGYRRGWIQCNFYKWRGQVVRRINILEGTNKRNYSDEELKSYLVYKADIKKFEDIVRV